MSGRTGRPKGRPPIKLDPEEVERFAVYGLTLHQIAWALGVNYETMLAKRKENPLLNEAISRGKAQGVAVVASTAFNIAKEGTDPRFTLTWLKIHAGWRESLDLNISGQVHHKIEDDRTKQLRILRSLTPEQRAELRRLQEAQDALIREALGPQEIEQTEQRAIETTARPVASSNGHQQS